MNIDHVVKTIIYLSRDDDRHWSIVERFLLVREESGCYHVDWSTMLELPTHIYDACEGLIHAVKTFEPDYFHSESYARILDDYGIPNTVEKVTGLYNFLGLRPKSQTTRSPTKGGHDRQRLSVQSEVLLLWGVLIVVICVSLSGLASVYLDAFLVFLVVGGALRCVWRIITDDLKGRFNQNNTHLENIHLVASDELEHDLNSITLEDGSVAVSDIIKIVKRIEYDIVQIDDIKSALDDIHVLNSESKKAIIRLGEVYKSDLKVLNKELFA